MRINYSLFFFAIFIFLLAFDIRSIEGSSKLFIILRASLGLLIGFFALRKIKYNKYSFNLIIITLIFSSYIFLVGLIRGQEVFQLFSLTMPYFFFLLGLIIVSSSLRDLTDLKKLINLIFIFILISAIYRVSYVLAFQKIPLEEARYAIISPTIILLFSYGITSLLFGYKRNWLIPISLSIFIILLSVTRTYLLVFIAIFIFAIAILRIAPIIRNIGVSGTIISISFIFLFGTFSVTSAFLDIWENRLLFGDSILSDPTFLTRIAEIMFQVRVLLESNINIIFGMGAAAETRFASEFYTALSMIFPQDYEYLGAGVGHNNYIGLIYVGGIFLGLTFIYHQFHAMWESFIFLRIFFKKTQTKRSETFLALWGSFSTFGYLSYGMLGGTFGDRLGSLSFGIAFGLMLLGIYKLQKTYRIKQ